MQSFFFVFDLKKKIKFGPNKVLEKSCFNQLTTSYLNSCYFCLRSVFEWRRQESIPRHDNQNLLKKSLDSCGFLWKKYFTQKRIQPEKVVNQFVVQKLIESNTFMENKSVLNLRHSILGVVLLCKTCSHLIALKLPEG